MLRINNDIQKLNFSEFIAWTSLKLSAKYLY